MKLNKYPTKINRGSS